MFGTCLLPVMNCNRAYLMPQRSMIALPIALEFPKKKASFTFEPILQIDPVSLAPLQLTKFDSLRLHQALVNTSESSEALDLCMTAMVAKGWVTYSPKLHKWEWHVPNDYPKAVVDLLYRKGLIDSKQAFISVCISQTGTPMNLKSTTITEGNNVRKLVMDLLNPILRYSSSKFLRQPESALTQAPSPLHSRQNSA